MAVLSSAQVVEYDNAERRRYPAIYREVPSSPQLGEAFRTDRIFLQQLLCTSSSSQYIELEQRFTEMRDQLTRLRPLARDWDTYGAPAPNEVALAAAETALQSLRAMNIQPTAVLPSADGGVGIVFAEGDRYAHIEFENSGDAWVVAYGLESPAATWQLAATDADSLRQAWDRISAGLQS